MTARLWSGMVRRIVPRRLEARRLGALVLIHAAATLGDPSVGSAQLVPGQSRIDRPELPDFPTDLDDSSPPGFELPRILPPGDPAERSDPTDRLEVDVASFRFSGNSVFSDSDLTGLAGEIVGKRVSGSRLQAFVQAVTRHYVAAGYVNSRARLPDQEVVEGVVRIQVIEGSLAEIEIDGARRLNPNRLKAKLRRRIRGPLNIYRVEEALQILRRTTLVERVHANLTTRDVPERALLKLRIEEANPWSASASYSNHQDPSVGSHGGLVELSASSLSGWTDETTVQLRATEGLVDLQGEYWLELNAFGTRLGVRGRYAESEVVQSPFDVLSIESRTRMFEVRVTQPILTTRTDAVELGVEFDHQASESTILDIPLPSEFASEGRTRVNAFRLTQSWIRTAPIDVFGFHSTVSLGTDWLDGTKNSPGIADSRFVSWLARLQYARRFPWRDARLVGRIDLQVANDPLLPLERFSVGGAATVRGFQENHLVRDNAAIGSIEMRIPILGRPSDTAWGGIAPFIDYGRAWNRGAAASETEDAASVGLGIIGRIFRHYDFEVYWGQNLTSPAVAGSDELQDAGFSIRVRAAY